MEARPFLFQTVKVYSYLSILMCLNIFVNPRRKLMFPPGHYVANPLNCIVQLLLIVPKRGHLEVGGLDWGFYRLLWRLPVPGLPNGAKFAVNVYLFINSDRLLVRVGEMCFICSFQQLSVLISIAVISYGDTSRHVYIQSHRSIWKKNIFIKLLSLILDFFMVSKYEHITINFFCNKG